MVHVSVTVKVNTLYTKIVNDLNLCILCIMKSYNVNSFVCEVAYTFEGKKQSKLLSATRWLE